MRSIYPKKPTKEKREKQVLLGLVELYLKSGIPIGSNTLRENGFEALSSATIRNYFAKLEEAGFLKQQHSSGGRIPTELAYKLYAETYLNTTPVLEKDRELFTEKFSIESREPVLLLQKAAELLSEYTCCAVFFSSPRFDQDFILDIKLVGIDQNRCLCILITDFGLVHSELLFLEKKTNHFGLKRIEGYLRWRLTGLDMPTLSADEEKIAQRFYNEVMLRHIVGSSNFSSEDVYRTGFSKLLHYPDFNNASALASGLSLFENSAALKKLLAESALKNALCCWIGDDLFSILKNSSNCSIIAVPYRIHQTVAGAFAILGPHRIPYRRFFSLLKATSDHISELLTQSLYKFKISFRQPRLEPLDFSQSPGWVQQTRHLLIDSKTEKPFTQDD